MPGEQIWPDRRTEQWCSSGRKILTSVQGLRSFSESSTGKPMLSFQYHASSEMRGCLSSATRIRVDVGDHAAIENGLAVGPAVIDAIQADDTVPKVHAHRSGDAHHFGQGLAQQR